jgi:glycosyltransferase involved in cell wall biosynthesis
MNGSLPAERLISVVIPTRNRPVSLRRLLRSLAGQTLLPLETIIVDASDAGEPESWAIEFPTLHIRLFTSRPSVCLQRNTGVAAARGSFIQFADDDIELPFDYLATLAGYLTMHPDSGAVSGLQSDLADGVLVLPDRRRIGALALIWSFIFQTSVWGSFEDVASGRLSGWLLKPVLGHYRRRGNTFSLGGWPLLTRLGKTPERVAVYGLGGAMIRKEWLSGTPFDVGLVEHGIGDNFGLAISFPGTESIALLPSTTFLHHRENYNRLPRADTYMFRILALDHFMRASRRFHPGHRLVLRWSVIGHLLYFLVRGDLKMLLRSASTLLRLLTGRDPFATPSTNG